MVRIKWLVAAKEDLKDIYDFISPDSKRYARLQVKRIRISTTKIRSHPEIGKIVEEIGEPNIREIVEGHYRIIYRIIDSELIHILMIHHGARSLLKRF